MQFSTPFGSTAADRLRRLIDVTLALGGLTLCLPIFLVLAVWIKLDSYGPVFYRATRVGREGAAFRLYKFRSMVMDADRRGPAVTAAGDSRITRSGSFIRSTKLDELPQLINVLTGDMSLIGPRPEDPRYVALYSAEQRAILAYRPGITSPASLIFRHEERLLQGADWENLYRTQIMPIKVAIDLTYMSTRTLCSDLFVAIATLKAL